MFKDKKSGKWIARFAFQGKQHWKRGFRTKQEAALWEIQKKEELKNPQIFETGITFSELSEKYLDDCERRMRPTTVYSKIYLLRQFFLFFKQNPPVEQMQKSDFQGFLHARQKLGGNIMHNRTLRELKACLNWGVANDLIKDNILKNVKNLPEENAVRYVPPIEDIDRVIMAASGDDRDIVLILYHTAGRAGEIVSLKWDDVNFRHREIQLWTRKRRGGVLQADKIPMSSTLADILKRRWENRNRQSPYVFCRPDGSPVTMDEKKNLMKVLCRRAGVKYFTFHAIRHHVASRLVDSDKVSLSQVQRFLRHKKVTTTDLYIRTLDRSMKGLTDVLDGLDGDGNNGIMNNVIPLRKVG